MRQQSRWHFMAVMVLAVCALSCAGCFGRWAHRERTASLQTVQGDLEYARLQTRETLKALDEVEFAPRPDLKVAYGMLTERVNLLTGVGGRLVRHATGMKLRGGAYIVEPETDPTQCRYPRLSDTGKMRTMELQEAFEPLSRNAGMVQRAYRAFEFDVLAIEDILSDHLNLLGVDAMEPFLRMARVDGDSLEQALEQALLAVQDAKKAHDEGAPEAGAVPVP